MDLSEIRELDSQYFFPVYGERLPVCFVRGEGVTLIDTAGKVYTDFLAGIATNSLGYSDEGFKAAVCGQVNSLIHISNYYYVQPQAQLAALLCRAAGYGRAFFQNSGAEAIECALKMAKKYHYNKGEDRINFVTLQNSFHGRTIAALAATGQDKFHTPFAPLPYSFTYVEAEDLNALEQAVTDNTAAVLFEFVQGEGGVLPLSHEYLKKLQEVAGKHGALLIADEIQTGMGRTGRLLAQMRFPDIRPDITTLAKALGNGVPIGAVLATEDAANAFSKGDHGTTFGGNPLACAAALYVTKKMTETDLVEQSSQTGEYFKEKLNGLAARHPDAIAEVRGLGLMLGVELKEPLTAGQVLSRLLARGFVVGTAGGNTLRLVPPLVIGRQHIDALISALEEVISCQN
ncbi:MAG: aspartate aminotransferase family protein [Candidatus Hydrogenedens sp.]|nr:aspartate aminotransferase family protein [Candidatus Hydrogenedens sp.]